MRNPSQWRLLGLPLVFTLAAVSSLAQDTPRFQTSDRCLACHNGLTTHSGEDISIGFDWRASMMANSARDPYWQAAVRRETIDHPEASAAIQDECAKCHMPMARYNAMSQGGKGEVFEHLPLVGQEGSLFADGVSCTLCHQIESGNLGSKESLVGGFIIGGVEAPGVRNIYGPFEVDNGRQTVMRSSTSGFEPVEASHVQRSELCATCHTLITHALGPGGEVIGELPEQVPYQEWLHSGYRESKSCQDCHMPEVAEPVAVTRVLGQPRENVSRHVFRGGNFFMPRLLNLARGELGVAALPQELETTSRRTAEHLETQSARLAIERTRLSGGLLEATVVVRNLAGHKVPTAYPSRRAWLHVAVKDREGDTIFESGKLEPSGLIHGNDNDADPRRFEPHYAEIRSGDQVQIYEAIMFDPKGVPTTGLLSAVRFGKDNRLLPAGFDKRSAGEDIAVRGDATGDADFIGGGDRVRYSMAVNAAAGPFHMEAELRYQPISFRWAHNLSPYEAEEPERFTCLYEAAASASSIVLASAGATVSGKP